MSEQAGDSPLQAARNDVVMCAWRCSAIHNHEPYHCGDVRAALDVFEWQAKVEALRDVPHENSLSVAEHDGTNVKPANMDVWMPCPYSPCRQIAAAETELADARRRREGAA